MVYYLLFKSLFFWIDRIIFQNKFTLLKGMKYRKIVEKGRKFNFPFERNELKQSDLTTSMIHFDVGKFFKYFWNTNINIGVRMYSCQYLTLQSFIYSLKGKKNIKMFWKSYTTLVFYNREIWCLFKKVLHH